MLRARPLLFLVAWAFLDALFNLRFPGDEPTLWYALPSIDVTVLLAVFLAAGARGYPVPGSVRLALVVAALGVRMFRFAEGLVERHFHRPLSLYLDVPLLPNLVGLLRSTVSLPRLAAWASLLALALVVLGALCWWALAATERALTSAGPRRLFVAGLVLCAALSPLWPQRRDPQLHLGLFGRSIVPALRERAVVLAPRAGVPSREGRRDRPHARAAARDPERPRSPAPRRRAADPGRVVR